MEYFFENIIHEQKLPFRIFFHRILSCSYHWHTDLEILLVLDGSVFAQVEGCRVVLGDGDILVINSGDIHLTHETELDNTLLAFQFDPAAALPFDPDFSDRRFCCNTAAEGANGPCCDELRGLLSRLMLTVRRRASGFTFEAASHMNRLLSLLVRHFQCSERLSVPSRIKREENIAYYARLSRIIRFIDKHYTERISEAALAEMEDIHPSYLSRFFHEKVGCTFGEYLDFVRIQKSLKVLTRSDTNISALALDMGFPSAKSYNRAFRAQFAMTPSAWRSEHASLTTPVADTRVFQSFYGSVDHGGALRALKRWIDD